MSSEAWHGVTKADIEKFEVIDNFLLLKIYFQSTLQNNNSFLTSGNWNTSYQIYCYIPKIKLSSQYFEKKRK